MKKMYSKMKKKKINKILLIIKIFKKIKQKKKYIYTKQIIIFNNLLGIQKKA